jgi:hypothetical protein
VGVGTVFGELPWDIPEEPELLVPWDRPAAAAAVVAIDTGEDSTSKSNALPVCPLCGVLTLGLCLPAEFSGWIAGVLAMLPCVGVPAPNPRTNVRSNTSSALFIRDCKPGGVRKLEVLGDGEGCAKGSYNLIAAALTDRGGGGEGRAPDTEIQGGAGKLNAAGETLPVLLFDPPPMPPAAPLSFAMKFLPKRAMLVVLEGADGGILDTNPALVFSGGGRRSSEKLVGKGGTAASLPPPFQVTNPLPLGLRECLLRPPIAAVADTAAAAAAAAATVGDCPFMGGIRSISLEGKIARLLRRSGTGSASGKFVGSGVDGWCAVSPSVLYAPERLSGLSRGYAPGGGLPLGVPARVCCSTTRDGVTFR